MLGFVWFCALICGLWILIPLVGIRHMKRVPYLDPIEPPTSADLPLLSVVVCACNEADTIEEALASLCAEGYPNLEIIVVNDRSTDGTGAVIEKLAAKDSRIRALHLDHLPDGWLGKVNAQQQAVAHASGEWILFTDADILYTPGALSRAVYYIHHQQQGNHLVVIPQLIAHGFWMRSFVHTFQMLGFARLRICPGGLVHPNHALGMGAFNLVRSQALVQTPGLQWLKMEVIDDIGLGLMFKEAGFRTHLLHGPNHVRVTWYPTLGSMARGLEKNVYGAISAWRPVVGLFKIIALALLGLAPWLLLTVAAPAFWPLALLGMLINFGVGFSFTKLLRQPLWTTLCFTPGTLLMVVFIARAMVLTHRNGGIQWRGTHYPLDLLRKGQRVFF